MSEPLVIGCNGFVSRIDTSTGLEMWRTKLLPGLFGGSSCTDVTVLIRGSAVFAGTHGNLFCLDLNTGQIVWRNELKGMGYNDVALAMEGTSVQVLTKVVHQQSSSS